MAEYDYIVVGAGSAGCTVAGRLSEDGRNVLLIEAGGSDDDPLIKTPFLFAGLFQGEKDWNYTSEPEPGLGERRIYLPRGKVLGGCSSMNAMFYMRGTHQDYDEWASVHGADGWSYDEVLPYFKRSENNADIRNEYHGVNGPMHVTTQRWYSGYGDAFIESALNLGIESNPDFNGASQEGVGMLQVTGHRGRRDSAADAFVRPALERKNFELVSHALVQRVIVESGRAVGVEYTKNGQAVVARAASEVILSAGSYNTPQLLMLSGIGPAGHLRDVGINVVHDLPQVGQNLQDHPYTLTHWGTDKTGTLFDSVGLEAAEEWDRSQTGPLTSNAGEAGLLWKSDDALKSPDIQMVFIPGYFWDHGFRLPSTPGMSIGLAYNAPTSRGSVSLRSADPTAAPKIVSNYLSQPHEVDAVLRAIEFLDELTAQKPLADVLTERVNPGRELTGERVKNWVSSETQHIYHAAGSCRIGTPEMGVVDAQLRVHGIDGLRIADASVMPQISRGNTNAPTIMIGEKAADLIKGVTLSTAAVAVGAGA